MAPKNELKSTEIQVHNKGFFVLFCLLNIYLTFKLPITTRGRKENHWIEKAERHTKNTNILSIRE